MDKCIGPMTEGFLNKIIKEVNKKKTKEKIMKGVIDPLLMDLSTRYYPYFITITCVMLIIIILLISILVLIVIERCSKESRLPSETEFV